MGGNIFTKKIVGVAITANPPKEILEYITTRLKNGRQKFYIVTPNPEILVYAHHHPSFKDVLNSADIALPDGIGLLWASKLIGRPLNHRITGVDLLEELCKKYANGTVKLGFLGGKEGVAEKAVECLTKKYPKLQVVFVNEEWEESGWVSSIQYPVSSKQKIQNTQYPIRNTHHIDLLFVAFGFPKQEQWIVQNLDRLPVTAAMGVGGAFDYISGRVGRAPLLVRRMGFEWLWRLIRQPWRIRRQLRLIEFIYLILCEKLGFIK